MNLDLPKWSGWVATDDLLPGDKVHDVFVPGGKGAKGTCSIVAVISTQPYSRRFRVVWSDGTTTELILQLRTWISDRMWKVTR